jgi:phospholipase C
MRVPLILISPWTKRGYVSHEVTSHVSLLRLVQARFDLPALTRRDANATPPYDMLDFVSPPRLEVPDLPTPQVEPNRHKHCEEVINRATAAGQVDVMKHRGK